MTNSSFHSNGKLLLSSEYFVLDGALALALPTRLGQSMKVQESPSKELEIHWRSLDCQNQKWHNAVFRTTKFTASDDPLNQRLQSIFNAVEILVPEFWKSRKIKIETRLEFPQNWGLGSSSTLLANLSKWSTCDPFELLKMTFGGSGYDIACALSNQPILYQLQDHKAQWRPCDFDPPFKKNVWFVHLGKKQNSRSGIRHYRNQEIKIEKWKVVFDGLTLKMLECTSLEGFQDVLEEHEHLVNRLLELPKAKSLYFEDFWGAIKSLGAWGGDFVMATSNRSALETMMYFKDKGYETVLGWEEMFGGLQIDN